MVVHNTNLGIVLMLLTFLVYSTGDLFTKILANTYGVPYFLLIRNTLGVILMGSIILAFHGLKGFKTNRPWVHFIRGIIVVFLSYSAAYAFKLLPFSTAYLIIFSAPIWTAILGWLIFKEPIGWKKAVAIFSGFIGVAIALDIESFNISFGLLAALLSAFSFSVYSVSSRYLDKSEPAALLNFYAFSPIILVSGFHVDWPVSDIITMTPMYWSCFILVAGLSVLGGILHCRSFQNAPASTIAPLHYSQLIYGVGLDLAFTGVFPGTMTWIGGAVIVVSGLYIVVTREKDMPMDKSVR